PQHAPPRHLSYSLSLHDALPIYLREGSARIQAMLRVTGQVQRAEQAERLLDREDGEIVDLPAGVEERPPGVAPVLEEKIGEPLEDRKSTRLNSSHQIISYAVFCL